MKAWQNRVLLFFALLTGSAAAEEWQGKVVNGYESVSDLYPWQVFLRLKGGAECGGTLIAPQWVLTAAHCVTDSHIRPPVHADDPAIKRPQDIALAVGKVHRDNFKYKKIVDQVHVYPQFAPPKAFYGDIALLHLSEPLRLPTITLPAADNQWDRQTGENLKVVGWGNLYPLRDRNSAFHLADSLQVTAFPLEKKHCAGFDPKTQLCAGTVVTDSCSGDSGGPLFRGIKDSAIQYGIVSAGFGCAQANKPGLYTRIAAFLPWITETLGADSESLKISREPVATLPPLPKKKKGKRALLIGVKDYYLTGLDLRGAEDDTALMKKFLLEYQGFQPDEIYTLNSAQATRNNIKKLVQEWLIKQTAAGDDVWLYFSGHGSLLPDLNGDEQYINKQVGIKVDQSLLPYDTDILTYEKSPTGFTLPITENHILDDEIYRWFTALKGRNVNVIFDACHAGSTYRGLAQGLRKSGLEALQKIAPASLAASRLPAVSYPQRLTDKVVSDDKLPPNIIYWGAVQDAEVAFDAPPGIFTRAFLRGAKGAADKNQDGHVTYAELLHFIRKENFAYQMTPKLKIDINKLDNDVLTGRPLANPPPPTETLSVALPDENPHQLKVAILDENGKKIDHLPLCTSAGDDCPLYQFKVSSQRAGRFQIYFLSDNGKGALFLPNRLFAGQSVNDTFLRAGETRVFNAFFTNKDPTPGMILAVMFDDSEAKTFEHLENLFTEQQEFQLLDLQEEINQREAVLLSPDQVAKASFVRIPILK